MMRPFGRAIGQRRLSEAERILWNEVTRGIAPLRPPASAEADEIVAAPAASGDALPLKPQQTNPAIPTRLAVTTPPLAPLGRRMRQQIARGGQPIGGRLDLHGLTQAEAHDALLGFLRSAQDRNAGLVLVITGKGVRGVEASDRGVLRRQVPHWLRSPQFRELVIGFESAHANHGGEGAIYVRVRRRRA